MKTIKMYWVLLVFTTICLTVPSCNSGGDDTNLEQESSLLHLSMELMENLSVIFPPEDLVMTISRNDDGSEQALFSLIGESKRAARLGVLASGVNSETTCDGAVSCIKAAKNCLDNGKKVLISNGACSSYCVTCQ